MSLQAQLNDLRRQRDQELRTLHITYVRTKRDLKRAASPDRIIRRHIGASLTLAALAGFLLAPRPSPRPVRARLSAKTGWLDQLRNLLLRFFPQLAEFIPSRKTAPPQPEHEDPSQPTDREPHTEPHSSPNLLRLLLRVVPFILGNDQLRQIILRSIRTHFPRATHNGDPTTPKTPAAETRTAHEPDP